MFLISEYYNRRNISLDILNVLNDIIISLVLSIAIWNNTQNERIQIKDDIVEYVESSQRTYFSLNVRNCFQVLLLTSEKLVWHNKPKVSFVNSRITSTKDILHAKSKISLIKFPKFLLNKSCGTIGFLVTFSWFFVFLLNSLGSNAWHDALYARVNQFS